MSDEAALTPREALERKKARLLEEVAAVEREMAERDQLAALAAKYNVALVEPQQNENQASSETVPSLAQRYRADERSPYQQLRHKTRQGYDSLLRRLERDLPDQIANLDKGRLEYIHAEWGKVSGVSMAHALITMLRGLATFGSLILKDRACRDLRIILHDMDFPTVRRQAEPLTREHVIEIRRKAHEMGRPSIALAQAFQFECGLWQKDVIGEWVPKTEVGQSNVTNDGDKWLRGLRWEKLDESLVLRHTISISGKEIEINLRNKKMVLEELMLTYGLDEMEVFDRSNLPPGGPIIRCEFSELPWTTHEFRRWWRKVADACGISKDVKNMGSRVGRQGPQSHVGNGKINPMSQSEPPKADIRQEDLAHVSRH
jgi:hypothetical protein